MNYVLISKTGREKQRMPLIKCLKLGPHQIILDWRLKCTAEPQVYMV